MGLLEHILICSGDTNMTSFEMSASVRVYKRVHGAAGVRAFLSALCDGFEAGAS